MEPPYKKHAGQKCESFEFHSENLQYNVIEHADLEYQIGFA